MMRVFWRTTLGVLAVIGAVISTQIQQEVVKWTTDTLHFDQPAFTIYVNHTFLICMLPLALFVRCVRRMRELRRVDSGSIDDDDDEVADGDVEEMSEVVAVVDQKWKERGGAVCSLCALLQDSRRHEGWGSPIRLTFHIITLAVLYMIPNVLWIYTMEQVSVSMFFIITQSVSAFVLIIEAVIHCKLPRFYHCCAVIAVMSGVVVIGLSASTNKEIGGGGESAENSVSGILNCVFISLGYAGMRCFCLWF